MSNVHNRLDTFMAHSWYIHDTFMIHSWYIHDTFMPVREGSWKVNWPGMSNSRWWGTCTPRKAKAPRVSSCAHPFFFCVFCWARLWVISNNFCTRCAWSAAPLPRQVDCVNNRNQIIDSVSWPCSFLPITPSFSVRHHKTKPPESATSCVILRDAVLSAFPDSSVDINGDGIVQYEEFLRWAGARELAQLWCLGQSLLHWRWHFSIFSVKLHQAFAAHGRFWSF